MAIVQTRVPLSTKALPHSTRPYELGPFLENIPFIHGFEIESLISQGLLDWRSITIDVARKIVNQANLEGVQNLLHELKKASNSEGDGDLRKTADKYGFSLDEDETGILM